MKCQCCGEEVQIGARFCMNCSAPIEYDSETREYLENEQLKLEKKKKDTKLKKKIIGCLSTITSLCVVCLVFMGIFYDKDSNSLTSNKVEKAVAVVADYKGSLNEQPVIEDNSNAAKNLKKVPLGMGNSMSSKSYEITLLDVDIVDKSYENAVLYTFHSGEEYAFVKVSLTNLLYEDAIYSSLFHFTATCDGKEVNQNKSGTLGEGNKFISIDGKNERRQTKTGYICYSLPEGWKVLEVGVNIDGIDNEPKLIVENPKNREISQSELNSIIEKCGVEQFLRDNKIRVDDEVVEKLITEFMHLNCLSSTDYVPPLGLTSYIQSHIK